MARSYRVAPYERTKVPTARQLHVLNRLGTGFSPAAFTQLRRAGGEMAWFAQQLAPGSVRESARVEAVADWFPRLRDSPAQTYRNDRSGGHQAWEYARDLSNYSLLRRIHSNRALLETMVELWSNHLHVEAGHFPAFTQRAAYDATIRAHALGRFEDLLVAATLHPAMLLYLDNWRSTRKAPNENHGRELLELHTVGVGSYTEDMVKQAARILSGHTVEEGSWTAYFDPARHATGPVSLLGFAEANATGDEPGLAARFLRVLARHPATARTVAHRLAVRFVSDDPPQRLVDRVASAYLASGTDIRATLRALVDSDEFWASAGRKVRTPADDLVATHRVRRVKGRSPVDEDSYAHALSWTLNSTLVFQWPRPDGPPDRAAAWGSTSRMLNSWQMHWNVAGGWWPRGRAKYPRPTAFLPRKRIRFDRFVDHLSRVVLGRRSTSRLLRAACEACDVRPGEKITRKHPVMGWKFPRLLAVLLDSPAHMSR